MLIHKKARPVIITRSCGTTGPPVVKYSHCKGLGFSNPPKHATKKVILQIKPRAKDQQTERSGQDKHQ